MKRVGSFQDRFRHPCCGLRFGGDAEPNAAAGFLLAPFSIPSTSEVDQQPAAAPAMTRGPRR